MRGEEFNDYIFSVCYGRLGVKWMAIEVWTTATADNNSQMCFYLVKLLYCRFPGGERMLSTRSVWPRIRRTRRIAALRLVNMIKYRYRYQCCRCLYI